MKKIQTPLSKQRNQFTKKIQLTRMPELYNSKNYNIWQ